MKKEEEEEEVYTQVSCSKITGRVYDTSVGLAKHDVSQLVPNTVD